MNISPQRAMNGARMSFESEAFTIQNRRFPALGPRAFVPQLPTEFFLLNVADGEDKWEIVGESKYTDNIRAVFELFVAHGFEENSLIAVLVHESKNAFDKHAVRVDLAFVGEEGEVDMRTAGYLPRHAAFEYAPAVRKIASNGYLPIMSAEVFGGTEGKEFFGVWLGRGNTSANADSIQVNADDLD